MRDLLCTEESLSKIFYHWDIAPEFATKMISLAKEICEHAEIVEPEYERTEVMKIIDFLKPIVIRKVTTDHDVGKFISDEIALAIQRKYPILCIESSSKTKPFALAII